MKHISTIKTMIDEGHVADAKTALENLLELGPNNLDALKIKALIFAGEGRFREEELIWHRILEIANDDEDAIDFVQQRQIDFYFTDDLPGGGRRFQAYSKALIKISFLGLIGCISFLLMTKLSAQRGWDLAVEGILAAFGIMVILPWLAIIYTWVTSLKHITISHQGIEVALRFKTLVYRWDEIHKLLLVSSDDPTKPNLRLVIEAASPEGRNLCLDLNEDSSAIRARSFLISEIASHRPELAFSSENSYDIKKLNARYC